MADYAAKNPEKVSFKVLEQKISTDCKRLNTKWDEFMNKMHPRLDKEHKNYENSLTNAEIEACKQLHDSCRLLVKAYQANELFKENDEVFYAAEDSLYEANFAQVKGKINWFSKPELFIWLRAEQCYLAQKQFIFLDKLMAAMSKKPGASRLDRNIVVMAPKKSVVHLGEKFECDFVLGAYSSKSSTIEISCNGKKLPMNEGLASFSFPMTKAGTFTLNAKAIITNPATGQKTKIRSDYKYDVRE
jgi:hypothetical protein